MASSNQSRLREAMAAGGPSSSKDKGPVAVDGQLSQDRTDTSEWSTRASHLDGLQASHFSSFLETPDGSMPADCYGKFTWKIENFSDMNKRELRSKSFSVGTYKWYILVYPHGCDVCNHLSLFLCVADYDQLLPGWSHFAQFTIAVVNHDAKKSKYSDTLHRFCKKEHDWGWKKFMEVSKVYEGFTHDDTLIIKAQVQVIRDRPAAPFRCLDPQYRRELVRVYLTNVEGICRRFVEERREQLQVLAQQLPAFEAFWYQLTRIQQQALVTERADPIFRGIVKRFFNDKEVTSTLVMDALFSGFKQTEDPALIALGRRRVSNIAVDAAAQSFSLRGDVITLLHAAATQRLPPAAHSDKGPEPPTARAELENDENSRNSVQWDEQRLAEVGHHAVEMYITSHIFLEKLAAAFSEAESMRRQQALIREEEQEAEDEVRSALRAAIDRERRARRKEKRKARQQMERAKQAEDAESAAAVGEATVDGTEQCTASAAAAAAAQAVQCGCVDNPPASKQIDSFGMNGVRRSAAASGSASGANGTADADDNTSNVSSLEQHYPSFEEVAALKARVLWLEGQLGERDVQIAALRAELLAKRAALPAASSSLASAASEYAAPHDNSLPLSASAADSSSSSGGAPSPANSSKIPAAKATTVNIEHSTIHDAGHSTAASRFAVANGSTAKGSIPNGLPNGHLSLDACQEGSHISGGSQQTSRAGSWSSSIDVAADAAPAGSLRAAVSSPLLHAGSLDEPHANGSVFSRHGSSHSLNEAAVVQRHRSMDSSSPAPNLLLSSKHQQHNGPGNQPRAHVDMAVGRSMCNSAAGSASAMRPSRGTGSGHRSAGSHRSRYSQPASKAALQRSSSARPLNGNAASFVPAAAASPAQAVSDDTAAAAATGAAPLVLSYASAAAAIVGGHSSSARSTPPACSVHNSQPGVSAEANDGDFPALGRMPAEVPATSAPAHKDQPVLRAATAPPATLPKPSSVQSFLSKASTKSEAAAVESPGLDDFAHMGLITDLLTE